MGNNVACCTSGAKDEKAAVSAAELHRDEAVPAPDCPVGEALAGCRAANAAAAGTYKVSLEKSSGVKLGLDVDYMAERMVLPIMSVTGGLAEEWNRANPKAQLAKGDSIVEVNGTRGNVALMLEKCKSEQVLEMTLKRALTYDHLAADLEELVRAKRCGPILIRLSWHDAGVFSGGKLAGGCPNAAMRFAGEGEGAFGANAGLPTVALSLLAPVAEKYCPDLISHADLWTLAANVAIKAMGGPDVPTRFGRVDAKSAAESVESQVGRLPDGDKGAAHLREIFGPKGFDDRAIVALSGAHTVGRCHADRSGFDGPWTESPLKFDNSYFKELLAKQYAPETTAKGCPQHRHAESKTIMLLSDLALLADPAFKKHVDAYAADQAAFFNDFADAWVKLQENGCGSLRDVL
mmetsp:Transcript_12727/g.39847  ORF Transcript_12727/g.39847 Transcript_12727/m.39847 type:complete len:406 (-) Transcript_12727:120-1337(-)